jgi:DNA-binding transcriptional MerR regulator
MSAITTEVSRENLVEELVRRYRVFLNRIPSSVLEKALDLAHPEGLIELARAGKEKPLSVDTRNQMVMARMRVRAYERVQSRCDLLKSGQAIELLGISRETLSQWAKTGRLAVYTATANGRKYYPAFQFRDNRVLSAIPRLISELGVDPQDVESMNMLVQHLVDDVDCSSAGEPSNIIRRFSLLEDPAADAILKRDWDAEIETGL